MTLDPDLESLSETIAAIYDTILAPETWPVALEKTAGFVGAKAATIGVHDNSRMSGDVVYSWGDDPELTRHYYGALAQTNPITVPVNLYCAPGEVFSISHLVPYEEFKATRLYREYLEPQGWVDLTHFVIEKSKHRFSHFGTAQEKTLATEATRERLQLLAPHVTRAVTVGRLIDVRSTEGAALVTIMDSLTAGVFLVRSDATPVYVNATGEKLLSEGQILTSQRQRITSPIKEVAERLDTAIATAMRGPSGRRASSIAFDGPNDVSWTAHVLPTREVTRNAGWGHSAAEACIFVTRTELSQPTVIEAVTQHYALTAGEARVLFALLATGSINDIVATLGISRDTVGTHLKRIYAKTGASGQADLVRLATRFFNPIA